MFIQPVICTKLSDTQKQTKKTRNTLPLSYGKYFFMNTKSIIFVVSNDYKTIQKRQTDEKTMEPDSGHRPSPDDLSVPRRGESPDTQRNPATGQSPPNHGPMSWLFDDVYEHRAEAQALLARVKQTRRNLKVRYERIDETTWIERNLTPNLLKTTPMNPLSVTRQEAEQAIALYRTAKAAKQESEAQMAEAERIIDAFGRTHLGDFSDGRLELDSGTLALKAGAAKPLKNGRPLPTALRTELAAQLPAAYVRRSCDFAELYSCADKMVRQLLAVNGIEIVREDRFVVL